MNCDSPHVLVVGAGSVGKRHALNLENLGCRVSCVDPRPDRLVEVAKMVSLQERYESLSEVGEDQFEYDGMVIASPPKFHVSQACVGVEKGIAVLLEKPVSKDLESAVKLDDLLRKHRPATSDRLVLGYTWRWWPALQYLRTLLLNDVIGQPHFARIHVSAHLADWHPWEPYQEFFMSSKDLGGGALLDESHWIDQIIWIFGRPERVAGQMGKVSTLDITSDDSVDFIASYRSGLRVSVHLDIFGRPHEKSFLVVGEKGNIVWTEEKNEVSVFFHDKRVEKRKFEHERNDMFVELAKEFVSVMRGANPNTCRLEDGINVLKVIEAVRESSLSMRSVEIV